MSRTSAAEILSAKKVPSLRVVSSAESAQRKMPLWAMVSFCALAVALVALVHHFWFVCDDAYISFRYAKNLAAGFGLRYNLGDGVPVEGYSNFLWVLLSALVELLGLDVTFWPALISSVCGLLLYAYLVFFLHKAGVTPSLVLAATSIFALSGGVAVWSSSGLAAMPFTLLCVGTALSLLTSTFPLLSILSASLLCLVRVEGVAWALFFLAVAFLFLPKERRAERNRWVLYLVSVLFTAAAQQVFRLLYYQSWTPNTAKVKVGLSAFSLERGFNYVMTFFLTFPGLAVLLLVGGVYCLLDKNTIARSCYLVASAFLLYSVLVGGDFMAMGRFLVPAIPFLIVSACLALQAFGNRVSYGNTFGVALLGSVALLNFLVAFAIVPVPQSLLQRFHFRFNTSTARSEYEQWEYMKENSERWAERGRLLAQYAAPTDSLVARAIGAVGYYSQLHIYDQYGLVTPAVSSLPPLSGRHSPGHDKFVPMTFFLEQNPTFLAAYFFEGENTKERIITRANKWQQKRFARRYVAAVVPSDSKEQGSLVLLRRIPEGHKADDAWKEFFASLGH